MFSDEKLIKNISNSLIALLRFCFRRHPQNQKFQSFLPLIDPLMASFNETYEPTSRKYIAQQCRVMPS